MQHLILHNPLYIRLEKSFGEWLQVLGFEPTTVSYAPIQLREFFYWLEARACLELKSIGVEEIEEYFLYLSQRANHRRGGGLSTNYLRKQLQVLNKFSRYLRETGQYHLEIPVHLPGQANNVGAILTVKEITALYEATDESILGLRDKAMLGVYYGSGLRREEGVQLNIEDVLLEKNLLYVRKGKNYKERYVPIAGRAKQDIQNYIEYTRPFLIRKHSEEPALLVSIFGSRIVSGTLLNRLKQLTARAGITKNVKLHTLRHSIATHLLKSGMELEYIKEFLGHTSIESTQIYTHIVHEQET